MPSLLSPLPTCSTSFFLIPQAYHSFSALTFCSSESLPSYVTQADPVSEDVQPELGQAKGTEASSLSSNDSSFPQGRHSARACRLSWQVHIPQGLQAVTAGAHPPGTRAAAGHTVRACRLSHHVQVCREQDSVILCICTTVCTGGECISSSVTKVSTF